MTVDDEWNEALVRSWRNYDDCEYDALAKYEDNGPETWGHVVETELQ